MSSRRTDSTVDRRAAAEQALEDELRRLVESGEYAAWFRRMAAFHRYSAGNTRWILAQRPDATRCASYRTWQQVGRQVRKGARGIMVLHPRPYWVDAGSERVRPPLPSQSRDSLQRRLSFGVGYVFDVADTDGEPLELGRPAPRDAPRALVEHLDAYCTEHRITVETRRLPTGLYGYYQRDSDRVVLARGLSTGEGAATLVHELAHREDPELVAADLTGDHRYYAHHRPDCEAVAEAAAHVLSARFGHDLVGHSAGYIATWIRGDVDRLVQLQDRVAEVTHALVPPDQLDLTLDTARQRVARPRTKGRSEPARSAR